MYKDFIDFNSFDFFLVEKYKDEILYDVVHMHAAHILSGVLDNLIDMSSMIGLRTNIFLKRMKNFHTCTFVT